MKDMMIRDLFCFNLCFPLSSSHPLIHLLFAHSPISHAGLMHDNTATIDKQRV